MTRLITLLLFLPLIPFSWASELERRSVFLPLYIAHAVVNEGEEYLHSKPRSVTFITRGAKPETTLKILKTPYVPHHDDTWKPTKDCNLISMCGIILTHSHKKLENGGYELQIKIDLSSYKKPEDVRLSKEKIIGLVRQAVASNFGHADIRIENGKKSGADNQSGDWLPIPDGYVWSEAVNDAPEFKPLLKKFANLPKIKRKGISNHWPENSDPQQVSIAEIDLNGDGKLELFLRIPAYSGTGGTFYEILSMTENKTYKSIGVIQGWGFQFLTKKNGWFQIEVMSRSGGSHYTRYLMTFGTKGYETTRNEGHDYHQKKVTIRKTAADKDAKSKPNKRLTP